MPTLVFMFLVLLAFVLTMYLYSRLTTAQTNLARWQAALDEARERTERRINGISRDVESLKHQIKDAENNLESLKNRANI